MPESRQCYALRSTCLTQRTNILYLFNARTTVLCILYNIVTMF